MKRLDLSNTGLRWQVIWLLVLGLAALACNLPYLVGQGEQVEAEVAAELEGVLNHPVKEVRMEGQVLVLAYEVPLFQAQETTLEEVALLLQTGAVRASRAEQVRVEVEHRGAPYLDFTAQAENARLLADGRLKVEAFLAGLQVVDRRPVELAVRQEMERMGYRVRSVSYREGTLELVFWQPEVASGQALVQSWLPLWQLATWRAPDASQVVLHVGLLGQPDLRVAAPTQLLKAFQANELAPAEFLLGLEFTDE
jgi:hypothetical protein